MVMQEELSILIQAQYPLIYLVTSEEERAEQTVAAIAQARSPQRPQLYIWTMTEGMVGYEQSRNPVQSNTVSPEAAIDWAIRQQSGIFLFKDLHPFKDSPAVTRKLRDAIAKFRGTQKNYYFDVSGSTNSH